LHGTLTVRDYFIVQLILYHWGIDNSKQRYLKQVGWIDIMNC